MQRMTFTLVFLLIILNIHFILRDRFVLSLIKTVKTCIEYQH